MAQGLSGKTQDELIFNRKIKRQKTENPPQPPMMTGKL
jgi:hypothetical protein